MRIGFGLTVVLLLLAGVAKARDIRKIVARDGSGDYRTVQEAFDDVTPNYTEGKWIITVEEGIYYEKLRLAKDRINVVLVGHTNLSTVLTYDDYADRNRMGTFRSTSVTIEADDFRAENITFENTHLNLREEPGENKRSQAVALALEGDRCILIDCRIVGNQDSFYGGGNGRHYLYNCYIEGNVDFIFGSSTMVFERCHIYPNQHESYITAPSTPSDARFGVVFLDCIIADKGIGQKDRDGVTFGHFYLGRPWKNEPRSVYIRCVLPESVHSDGWTVMSAEPRLFAEYGNTGPGASPDKLAKRKMGRQLTDEEAAEYTVERIFSSSTRPGYSVDWVPDRNPVR